MKQTTRDRIAIAAAKHAAAGPIEGVLNCTAGTDIPLDADNDGVTLSDERILFEMAEDEAVSLEFKDDLFLGWELNSGSYFAGAIHESNILLFDSQDGRYYRYVLH